MDDRGEVCFEEKVGQLRDSGMSADEISQQMGVDQAWVDSLISMWEGAYTGDEDAPTSSQ